MSPGDIRAVSDLVSVAMNSEEGEQARETLRFHFGCRQHGLDDGRSYYVLASHKGVAGIVGLHRYIWGPPENVWLAWFAVRPELKGAGLGNRLMTAITELALNQGYKKLYVETYSTSEFADARRFYEAKGFAQVGEVTSYLPNDGDMVVYAKELTHHE